MTVFSWKRFKKLSLAIPELPLFVDLSRTSLSDDAFASDPLVSSAFPAAFSAMTALEKGAISNPDEDRRVGHYWLRAPGLAPEPELTGEIESTTQAILGFVRRVHAGEIAPEKGGRFENVLIVGIGGSALGPQFVADALGSPTDPIRPFYLDNTDPDGIARELARVEAAGGIGKTLTVVISKSGGTKETRNGQLEAAEAYRKEGLSFARHAIAITQEGSALDKTAVADGWLARFPMWDWVGGRTSVLSAVGLLPLALQGIDVEGLLDGAAACDVHTRKAEIAANPAALLALAWYRESGGCGQRDMVILPYKDRLLLLSRYLQQLVMESLGKEKDLHGKTVNQGLAVYGNKGSTDQHAFVQQLRDGVHNFFVTFIEVLKDQKDGRPSLHVEKGVTAGDYLLGFLLGTREALAQKGRGSITLTVGDVSARSIGILIALYERTVGLYALLTGINAYHQPGVEAGKKAAAEVLTLQAAVLKALRAEPSARRTAEEVALAAGKPEATETVWKLLEHLAANPDHGVVKVAGADPFSARYGCSG